MAFVDLFQKPYLGNQLILLAFLRSPPTQVYDLMIIWFTLIKVYIGDIYCINCLYGINYSIRYDAQRKALVKEERQVQRERSAASAAKRQRRSGGSSASPACGAKAPKAEFGARRAPPA